MAIKLALVLSGNGLRSNNLSPNVKYDTIDKKYE